MQQGETIEAMLSVKHGGMLSRNTSSTLGAFAVPWRCLMATSLAEFLTQSVILDFRPTLSGRLFQHNVVTSLLDTLGCERLGATWILCLKGS